jgi:hypothetical protein
MVPFAFEPIIKWGALPAIVGAMLIVIGKITGTSSVVIAGTLCVVPFIWGYLVIIAIVFPCILFWEVKNRIRKH